MANQVKKSGIRTARQGILLTAVWSAVGLGWTGFPLAKLLLPAPVKLAYEILEEKTQ